MGGSGGGIIVQHNTAVTLSDPQVHGALPQRLQNLLDPILAKTVDQWDEDDKFIVGHVYAWALCNLA